MQPSNGWFPDHRRFLEILTATVATNPWIPHQTLTDKQSLFLAYEGKEAMYGGAAGGGKALALETPVPTLSGWTTMGAVQVGDFLFDEKGMPCRVIVTSEVFHDHDCYEVVFDDGEVIISDADHRWLTFTAKDRMAMLRRTEEWRAKRRSRRLSRVTGKRTAAFTAALVARNKAFPPSTKCQPSGTIRTTREIAETLLTGSDGRVNHSIPVSEAIILPDICLPIPPYVLGVWLGDGASAAGKVYVDKPEEEILRYIESYGYTVRKIPSEPIGWCLPGFVTELRRLNLLFNKHVPQMYFRASAEQRLELLRGLMDTDGTCDGDGNASFTNTRRCLADAVLEIATSLGIKATLIEGRAKLYGKDCGPKYIVAMTTMTRVFNLKRKAAKQPSVVRATQSQRYIVSCRKVASVPVRCLGVDSPSHLFLAGRSMVPTHNTDALLTAALQYVDCPGYAALILMRSYADLSLPKAGISRSKEWLSGTAAAWSGDTKTWRFPSGATLTFGYMEHDDDRFRYRTAEFQYIAFDELTQFSELQYTYMFTRLRRLAGSNIPNRMRSATNPGGRGHDWVKRRFIPDKFFDVPEDERFNQVWMNDGRAFFPARIEDNPHLDREEYEASLDQVEPVARQQMKKGDWKAHAGGRFKPEWWRRYRLSLDTLHLDDGSILVLQDVPRIVIVDPANRKTKASKFTAIGTYGDLGGQRMLCLDMVRKQMALEEIVPELYRVCQRWQPDYCGIEANGFQIALVNEARDGRRYPRMPTIKELEPAGKSKLTRATGAIIRAEQGQFFLPEKALWLEDFEVEHQQFLGDDTQDAYSDQVDVTSYASKCFEEYDGGIEMPMDKMSLDQRGPAPMRFR